MIQKGEVVQFPTTLTKVRLARDLYLAISRHARDRDHMSDILGDMLKFKPREQVTKDLVVLMVMIHKDESWDDNKQPA